MMAGSSASGWSTLVLGTAGMLTAIQLQRLVAYSVIVSAGTLLAALGLGGAAVKSAALFYLASSVLATGAFFMLSEMILRTQQFGENGAGPQVDPFSPEDSPDPDFSDEAVGIVIPAAMAFLGMSFLGCALLITGLPPLSGFVGKLLILSAALDAAPCTRQRAGLDMDAVGGDPGIEPGRHRCIVQDGHAPFLELGGDRDAAPASDRSRASRGAIAVELRVGRRHRTRNGLPGSRRRIAFRAPGLY